MPLFASFDLYLPLMVPTAAMTPPLAVTLLLWICWRGFPPKVAIWTMLAEPLSLGRAVLPGDDRSLAHGVEARDAGDGIFGGMKVYKFMRAFWALWCLAIAFIGTVIVGRKEKEGLDGLVWGTVPQAIRSHKGAEGKEGKAWVRTQAVATTATGLRAEQGLVQVRISETLAQKLGAQVGEMVYVAPVARGLRSSHAVVG